MALRSLPQLVQASEWPNVSAFGYVLRFGETTLDDTAWTMLYGGSHFSGFDDHPRKRFPLPDGNYTTAAGAFQITESSWNDFTKAVGSLPFTPENQYLCAVWLMDRAKALDDVIAGRLDAAIRRLGPVWTSLRTERTQKNAARIYREHGGATPEANAPNQATNEVKPMLPAAVLFPLLDLAGKYIPQLLAEFSGNKPVAERNVAAANIIAKGLVDAVAPGGNLQEAVQALEEQPETRQAAITAVAELWPQVFEAGGGGIQGARNAAAASDGDFRKVVFNGPFLLALGVLPLVYLVVLAAVLKMPWLAEITSEVRTGVITSVTGLILGSLMGYFYGTSASSQRKDAALAAK